jgi:hypothetical protein
MVNITKTSNQLNQAEQALVYLYPKHNLPVVGVLTYESSIYLRVCELRQTEESRSRLARTDSERNFSQKANRNVGFAAPRRAANDASGSDGAAAEEEERGWTAR